MQEGLVLKSLPAHRPKIKVMDAYCKPLAGAKVYVRQEYGLKSIETSVGVTNAAGELIVPTVYKGAIYTFRAALPGYSAPGNRCPAVGGESWIDSIEIVMGPATNP